MGGGGQARAGRAPWGPTDLGALAVRAPRLGRREQSRPRAKRGRDGLVVWWRPPLTSGKASKVSTAFLVDTGNLKRKEPKHVGAYEGRKHGSSLPNACSSAGERSENSAQRKP